MPPAARPFGGPFGVAARPFPKLPIPNIKHYLILSGRLPTRHRWYLHAGAGPLPPSPSSPGSAPMIPSPRKPILVGGGCPPAGGVAMAVAEQDGRSALSRPPRYRDGCGGALKMDLPHCRQWVAPKARFERRSWDGGGATEAGRARDTQRGAEDWTRGKDVRSMKNGRTSLQKFHLPPHHQLGIVALRHHFRRTPLQSTHRRLTCRRYRSAPLPSVPPGRPRPRDRPPPAYSTAPHSRKWRSPPPPRPPRSMSARRCSRAAAPLGGRNLR